MMGMLSERVGAIVSSRLRPAAFGQLAALALVGLCNSAASPPDARANSFVQFDYNIFLQNRARGTVFVELFDDRPLTTANFLQYINGGLYNNTLMHRLALTGTGAPFVLQGGGYYPQYLSEPDPLSISLNPNAKVDLDGNPNTANPTVANEFNNVPLRSNIKGTIAMAKLGGDPNSASNEYFFNLNDNSANLDFQNGGFTVFARVVGDGMSLIDVYGNDLPILNMNPDYNDDGQRDAGYPFNELPAFVSGNNFLPLIVNRAKAVDYLGNGLTTDVPAGGLTFANKDAFIDTGAAFIGSGSITIGTARRLGIREGFALNRSLLNHGTLAPGLDLGSITLQSTYFQYSDGTLNVQLGGTTADTQYDRLVVGNTAFLAGKLQVALIPGYTPARGNTFTVLTAGSIVGAFTVFDLPVLTGGLVWDINQTSAAVTLTIADADYNGNGIVDAGDYVVWRKQRNTSVTAGSGADGTGDGLVNDADLLVWRNNLGNRSGGIFAAGSGAGGLSDTTVPEPASAFLILVGAFILAVCRRSRR
jgi:cyclophilin family peptidyl-prolyl cis-trans isomerase